MVHPRPTPRPVLFDLDGTLIDTIELLLTSVRHAFRDRTDRAPTTEQWIAGIGTPLASQLRPWAADDAELAALSDSYRSFQRVHHDRLTRCYDDALATVRRLHERGHPMAVVTSKPAELAHRSVSYVGLAPYLPVIVGVNSTARNKPHPEPVLFALERLGVPAASAVFVGDSPHDIAAGNAAGVATIAALWGPFTREQLAAASPTYFLDRIAGLPALLDRMRR
jgi:pyrophosphatase PpaX